MSLPRIEDVETPVVGRFYDVPTVDWRRWVNRSGLFPMPVLGPLHEDREHIGFSDDHWHFDWRFAPQDQLVRHMEADHTDDPAIALKSVATAHAVRGSVYRARWKCRRPMPVLPVQFQRIEGWMGSRPFLPIPWLPALERAFAGEKLPACRKCPHRGLPLRGLPETDGVVVCPGHGLAWDVQTGALVRRTQDEEAARG